MEPMDVSKECSVISHPSSLKRLRRQSVSSSSSSDSFLVSNQSILLHVIISFPSLKKCFKQLSLNERKSILSALSINFPLTSTRVDAGGDLFVHADDQSTRDLLLQQEKLGDIEVKCSRTNRETECKKIIFGVPKEDAEEEIVAELSRYGVIKVLRLRKRFGDVHVTTEAVILWFSCAPPSEVLIANEIFRTHDPRQRPLLCRNCWLLGHTASRCRQKERNCNSNRHTSDDKSCPAYRMKQKILNFAQAENLSFHQAKEFLSKNAPHQQSSPAKSLSVSLPSHQKSTTPLPAPNDAQIEALQLEVTKLQVEVKSLRSHLLKYTPLDITTKMQENITSTKNLYENLKTTLDSIAPVMVRLTPNIPYIEEICRIVRQQNQNTSSTPTLLSTEGSDTNQHVTTHPGSQKPRHE
ncbi:uncharacterized protein LOC123474535 [Daphnia magna]|uniref:uncharacterized protein LOC123474535 n=1 Tax=Daphnia magna TaxID=35525 RepID=UPI001E1BD80B|nr:uncharacterized protein LOC123474535 [Daphnia magna]